MNQEKVLLKNKRFILSFIFIAICTIVGIIAYVFLHQKYSNPPSLESIVAKYDHLSPTQWGEKLEGITSLLPDKSKPVAYLTFDACGGAYDKALIDYLIAHNIQATLFINARWIHNTQMIYKTRSNPLFFYPKSRHKTYPLSVNGKSICHIKGT